MDLILLLWLSLLYGASELENCLFKANNRVLPEIVEE